MTKTLLDLLPLPLGDRTFKQMPTDPFTADAIKELEKPCLVLQDSDKNTTIKHLMNSETDAESIFH